jgi:hypothetical protein
MEYCSQATITFEVRYCPPGGEDVAGAWSPEECVDDERQMLVDIEQNIANLERSLSATPGRRASWGSEQMQAGGSGTRSAPDKSPAPTRKRYNILIP